MWDVARRAGVSQTTVSFVVNGVGGAGVSNPTRERVMAAVRELGYRPNWHAQSLRLGSSNTIGFITDAIATTPFAGEVIRGAQDAAWQDGHVLLVVNTDMRREMDEEAIGVMLEQRVRGIVYSTWFHREVLPPPEIYEVPSVLVDCYSPDASLDAIVPDEVRGGRRATEVLLHKGHRRVAFLNSDQGGPAPSGRLQGYREALAAQGMSTEDELVVYVEPNQEGSYRGMMELLDAPEPPTAIFCFNDRMAMGAYAAAFERGLSIPGGLSVVGFDNQEVIAAHLRPPLSTVALPHYEMGRLGVMHLLRGHRGRAANGGLRRYLVNCPYIPRASVRALPSRQRHP